MLDISNATGRKVDPKQGPYSGPRFGPANVVSFTPGAPKTAPFWNHFSARFQHQASALWQWSNFIHDFAPQPQAPVRISLDETSIRLHQDAGDGFLVEAARRKKRTSKGLTQSVPKSAQRGSFTHVAMVCDDCEVQKLLPQFLLLSAHQVSVATFAELQAAVPANVVLQRDAKAWMTSKMMVTIISKLAVCLADVLKSRPVILYADVYKSHISNVVWTACARAGIYYCLIPAKLTWALHRATLICSLPINVT